MPRLGLGLGLNLPRPIFLGGGSPSVPVGALATYTAYSPSNFTLVTDNKVNVWQDETTNGNDLTQSTSGNQPTLVEDNTVTQFTASNQPTFAKDKQVTQVTLANMPTYDATEGALAFDGDNMGGLTTFGSEAFAIEFKLTPVLDAVRILVIDEFNTVTRIRFQNDGKIDCISLENTTSQLVPSGSLDGTDQTIKIVYNGTDNFDTYIDGNFIANTDVTGLTYSFNSIGYWSTPANALKGNLSYFKKWNSADSSGAPDFYLDASDPSTMLNDSSEEPQDGDSVRLWHDPSAVDVMAFDPLQKQSLDGLTALTGDFAYKISIKINSVGSNNILDGVNGNAKILFQNSSSVNIYDSASAINSVSSSDIVDEKTEIILNNKSNLFSVYFDGILQGSFDSTGKTYDFKTIGRGSPASSFQLDADLYLLEFYENGLADPTNITETPDFTLTPDPTKLRTSANANPVLGENVAKWYADEWSGYRDSRVVFDGTDDNMSGLPPQTGDFTYVFDLDVSNTAQTEYIFSGTDSSALLILSDNKFYLRQSTGASDQVFITETVQAGTNVYALVREGNDVRWYVNSVLKDTLDVTGRSFNFNTVGANADSMGSFNSLLNVFDRVLTQDEINYFSYLRSDTGEILLPPLLPS